MNQLSVIKIGGNVLDDEASLNEFLSSFSSIEGKKILVHGGGKKASEVSDKLGVKSEMVEGRRITSSQMLDVATMVYGGLINKNIVSRLNRLGIHSIGLTGADLSLIPSRKRIHPSINYGFVGDPIQEKFNSKRLNSLLNAGIVPVFSALTFDINSNTLLNTNADTIAATIAIGLSSLYEVSLFYGFEKEGVLKDASDNESVISEIPYSSYQDLKEQKIISEGMIPKLDNSFHSINSGVRRVVICKAASVKEYLSGNICGTTLTN